MNSVVHFEIPVDDMGEAKRFYGDVFGWRLADFEGGYVLATTTETGDDFRPKEPGAINGGLMARGPDAPAPVVVISVASVDEHLEKVTAAGGEIVRPTSEVPGMGFYAYVTDPAGNVVGLWQNLA